MLFDYPDIESAAKHSKDAAMAVNVSENRILCRVMGRWKMFIDARDISVLPHLAMDGIYNPTITQLICDIVKPGMICADVGACFGYHALLMSELVGPTGRVLAFEPHPRVFPMLKHNIEINGFCPRARPYPNAIGDISQDGILAIHKRRFGGATLAEKAKASFGCVDSADVKVSRLDDLLLPHYDTPDFYLIATEGYEPNVFAGMKALLKSKRKITIVMEVTPRWYEDAFKFYADIIDEGFLIWRIAEGGNREIVSTPAEFITKFKSHLLLTR